MPVQNNSQKAKRPRNLRRKRPKDLRLTCCPCGCDFLYVSYMPYSGKTGYWIECSECGLSTKMYFHGISVHGAAIAAEAWNRGDRRF